MIVVNGINGVTGRYAVAPQSLKDLAQALKKKPTGACARHVIQRGEKLHQRSFTRALPWGVEPHDVARAGWGIVFHEDESAVDARP